MKSVLSVGTLVLASFFFATASIASDDVAQAKLDEAKELFEGRTDLANVEKALPLLADAEAAAVSTELKYDIMILTSRAVYWKGTHSTGKEVKMALFETGQNKAQAAVVLNKDLAEGYYFAGINLARWAETKGILESLGRRKELMELMDQSIARTTRDGDEGESVDGYGPDRVLGRMFFKLPGFAGGSHDKAVKFLDIAVKNAADTALNVVYLAETLWDGNGTEKTRAKKLLDDLLANDEKTYNTDRTPETIDEFAEARKLRKDMR